MLTADALVAGVHFFADDPRGAIAAKALRVNLSDLAAKGARAARASCSSLALPRGLDAGLARGFRAGLGDDARDVRLPVDRRRHGEDAGAADASRSPRSAPSRAAAWPRAPARGPGDRLYVAGRSATRRSASSCGSARAGAVGARERAFLLDRYLLPRPRLALAPAMAAFARGGMDVSDGFAGDLAKMLRVSGVSAEVALAELPLSAAARAAIAIDPALFAIAATGGDDYELLAAVDAGRRRRLRGGGRAGRRRGDASRRALGGGAPPRFVDARGAEVTFERGAFSHF